MSLLGRAVLIAVTVPFVVGLYVGTTKPSLVTEAFVAYDNTGVLGVFSVLASVPDVLAVAGLAVLIVIIGPEPLGQHQ
jgi:hypothetical protein